MDAAKILTQLCRAIDEHRWDELPALLADDFVCRYVHTGEQFDAGAWVRLNAEYPGFERMVVEEVLGDGNRAVARCRVSARQGREPHLFAVATFITTDGQGIREMTEVWTDVAQPVPNHARPS